MPVAEKIPEEPIIYGNDLYRVELNEGLSEAEIKEATDILRWIKGSGAFFGVAGIMLVTGPPRSGKDTFANVLAWKVKRFFKGIKVVRDDHPTNVFGQYTFWDESLLADDLERMREVAQAAGEGNKKAATQATKKLAEQWVTDTGSVMMQKSVVLFTEAWQKMNNRRGMTEMNLMLGGLNKMWGHSETLYLYVAQWTHDLDRFTCLPWVTHEVRCQMSTTRANTVEAHLYQVKYNRSLSKLITQGLPVKIKVDAGKERQELGIKEIQSDGTIVYNRYWDLFNSKSAPLMRFKRKNLDGGL